MSDDPVRAQYEAYPYPERHPADESARLIIGSPSHLLELGHYVFAGRRDFGHPFRALVAGGGTGDGAIMLAQQLADTGGPGEVVHLEVSAASRAVAEARARARGLTNIGFLDLAIEDLDEAALGRFDYIDCCGVLHHLADPRRGLAALARVLAADGGMGLMLYGRFGRTGVYAAQAMLRMLDAGAPPAAKVALARSLLAELPPTNWLKRNPYLGDHLDGGDAGLYDLLLHQRDRAYTVPEIAALAAGAGLCITAFVEPARYDPDSYVDAPDLRRRLAGLAWIERCAFAELLAGNMRKHVFYVVHAANPGPVVAAPDDGALVPCLHEMDGAAFAQGVAEGSAMTATIDGAGFRFPLPPLAADMVARMDGRRSLGQIHAELRGAEPGLDWAAFAAQLKDVFAALNGLGKLYLRMPPAP